MNDLEFKKLKKFIDSSENFIICGHENPDPDCICSCIAFEHLLSVMGKKAICINSDAMPTNLISLDYKKIINSIESGAEIPDNINEYSLFILDTNSIQNIGRIHDLIIDRVKGIFVIDHHSALSEEELKDSFINGKASSVSEIIYEIYELFNIEMPQEISEAIYTGILFDTGSFHYSKTSSYTFYVAANLVEKGVNPYEVYLLLYEQESIEYLKITSLVLSSLKLYHNNNIAVIEMPKKMLIESGAKYDESASIINIPLRSKDIKVVIFCKENLNGIKRISMRSKGDVDVVKIATKYNGGGHKNAAGFKLNSNINGFDDIIPILIDYLIKQINKYS